MTTGRQLPLLGGGGARLFLVAMAIVVQIQVGCGRSVALQRQLDRLKNDVWVLDQSIRSAECSVTPWDLTPEDDDALFIKVTKYEMRMSVLFRQLYLCLFSPSPPHHHDPHYPHDDDHEDHVDYHDHDDDHNDRYDHDDDHDDDDDDDHDDHDAHYSLDADDDWNESLDDQNHEISLGAFHHSFHLPQDLDDYERDSPFGRG